MEAPQTELEVFSSLSLQEYIRLMTAAYYLKKEKRCDCARFAISADDYAKMMEEPLQMPLIGLSLSFDEQKQELSVVPDDEFLQQYENKLMADVVEQFYKSYKMRYSSRLILKED